jgi:endogenous inhibitor of DNA gyrase (YacG/DUF329 family)|tara:strand:- start:59 stop:292 length:234 start_codon:yes stop_codon:yes gene_type:complete
MTKNLEVNCPSCSKAVAWIESSSYRPFCSDRCKQIDLGAWADESYAIPVEAKDEWELADQQTQLENLIAQKSSEQSH